MHRSNKKLRSKTETRVKVQALLSVPGSYSVEYSRMQLYVGLCSFGLQSKLSGVFYLHEALSCQVLCILWLLS